MTEWRMTIKKLIAKDRIEESLDVMCDLGFYDSQVNGLMGQLEALRRQVIAGVVNPEVEFQTRSKIRTAILALTENRHEPRTLNYLVKWTPVFGPLVKVDLQVI